MPNHHNLRRYQGPGVWAHVRADYLAGEPARVVAERYGVSVASLRKRSSEEGWTRAAHARASDRPAPPGPAVAPLDEAPAQLPDLIADALTRAGRQLAEGRGAEAAATLKALEALEALRRLHADLAAEAGAEAADEVEEVEEVEVPLQALDPVTRQWGLEGVRDEAMATADALARHLLTDQSGAVPVLWSACALHWRARHLGPEAAAADHAIAVSRGGAGTYWDADGRLRPLADLLAQDRRRFAPNLPADDPLPPVDGAPAWLEPIIPG